MITWGLKIGGIGITWLVGTSALVIKRLGDYPGNRVVFGNYKDYISPEVLEELKKKYSILPDYFSHDHVVKEKFHKGTYDVAVVSTSILEELKKSSLVKKIDWKKFNLKHNSDSIEDKSSARNLFSEVVKDILGSEDLLDYGIPYFLNKLSFCYRGNKINSISDSSSKITWEKLIEEISKNGVFKSENGKPKLGLIDDPRTVLSLSRLVDGKSSVNPNNNEYKNPEGVFESYSKLKERGLSEDKLGKNFLFIDPNSSTLLDSLASKDINGAFMYNGDCLYAASGGNVGEKIDKDDFHIAELSSEIYFLDFITFSSKLDRDKLDKAYEFTKELLFSGYDEDDPLTRKENTYKHTSIRNFDYVQYTPVLDKHLKKIEESFFNDEEDNLNETKKSILKIDKPSGNQISNYYERAFSPDSKNDMLIAFERFKLTT